MPALSHLDLQCQSLTIIKRRPHIKMYKLRVTLQGANAGLRYPYRINRQSASTKFFCGFCSALMLRRIQTKLISTIRTAPDKIPETSTCSNSKGNSPTFPRIFPPNRPNYYVQQKNSGMVNNDLYTHTKSIARTHQILPIAEVVDDHTEHNDSQTTHPRTKILKILFEKSVTRKQSTY